MAVLPGIAAPSEPAADLIYPESDGKKIAESTRHFWYITSIATGLDAFFRDDPNVFVAGNLFWYPVEGRPDIVAAPDAMVVFGRPKGDRRTYLQWREGGIAPQVVFEILSLSNTAAEMAGKFRFYDRYGVEEYYVYDSERGTLSGWHRRGATAGLAPIESITDWTSPRLGLRPAIEGTELWLYKEDGEPLRTYRELAELVEQAKREHDRAEEERSRAERLAAQLRALGVEPNESPPPTT